MIAKACFKVIAVLGVAAFCSGCIDRPSTAEEYLPEVATVRAVMGADGSVQVTGRIDQYGEGELYYAGCAMDSVPEFRLSQNQVLADGVSGDSFTVVYPPDAFLEGSFDRIFVKAFAFNDFGYAYGRVLEVGPYEENLPMPEPPEVPCELSPNSYDDGSGMEMQFIFESELSEPGFGPRYLLEIEAIPNRSLKLRFDTLQNGIYRTASLSNASQEHRMYIGVQHPTSEYVVNSNAEVYVVNTGPDLWEISICSAPWLQFNLPRTLKGNIRVAL